MLFISHIQRIQLSNQKRILPLQLSNHKRILSLQLSNHKRILSLQLSNHKRILSLQLSNQKRILPLRLSNQKRILPLRLSNQKRILPLRIRTVHRNVCLFVNTSTVFYSSTVSKRNLNNQSLIKMKLISNNPIRKLRFCNISNGITINQYNGLELRVNTLRGKHVHGLISLIGNIKHMRTLLAP